MRSSPIPHPLSRPSGAAVRSRIVDANGRRLPVAFTLLAIFLLGTLAVIVGGRETNAQGGYAISRALVWGFGFCVSGMLLGFLFAIPRILPAGAVVAPSAKAGEGADAAVPGTLQGTVVGPAAGGQSEINSNLVEVSDWLTKIIVGVGLVELKHLPVAAENVALFVAPSLGFAPGQGAPVVGGIMLFYSVHGFLIGYLLTRLYLSMLLKWADNQVISQIPVLQLPGGDRIGAVEMLSQLKTGLDDVQNNLLKVMSQAPGVAPPEAAQAAAAASRTPRVLWVDDVPTNNALVVDSLKGMHVIVDQVVTTDDAMRLLTPNPAAYDLVITDMGRREGSVDVPDAGVILTGKVKRLASSLPVLVYCSSYKKQAFGPKAQSAGAQLVTTSSTELLGEVKRVLSQAGGTARDN